MRNFAFCVNLGGGKRFIYILKKNRFRTSFDQNVNPHPKRDFSAFCCFQSSPSFCLFRCFLGRKKLQAIIALFSTSCQYAVNHRGFLPKTQGFFPCRGEDSRRPSKDSTGSIRSKSSAAWWIVSHHGFMFFFFGGGCDIPHRNSEMLF